MRRFPFLFSTFLFLLLCLIVKPVKATHLMGTDITYTCVNNCTIQVDQRVYRDCAGSQAVQQQNFQLTGAPGCIPPTQIGGWLPGNNPGQITSWAVSEVTPVCPGTVTQCSNPNSSIRGVQEYHRWTQFDICSANCNSYTIEWWGLARNGGITSGAANEGLGSFLTTINTGLATCNNSPQFNNPPVPYICAGQPFTFNQGANDPDGDSLAYSLGQCFTDQQTSITYNPGYSPNAPLGPSWLVVMNPISGDVSFVPQPGNLEVGVMCVYVEEWRNGQLINTIVRDMQINVISCPNNQQPVGNNVTNVQNGSGQGNSTTGIVVGTCLNNALCFDIPLFDANLGDTITAWWNHAIPSGQFFLSGNPGIQDTITGVNPTATFCWTPTSAGIFSFLIEMRDNACPQYGFSQFTVTIIVSHPTALAAVQSIQCDTATLCGFGFTGIQPYSFSWAGQGGLSGNTSCISNVYPGPGPYTYTLTVTDSLGCTATFNGQVVIPTVPVADAGPDFLACQLFSDSIGGPSTPNMTYLWNPTTGLSSSIVSNPLLTLINPGPTVQQYQYVVTQTSTTTGCLDRDTMNITISYPPQLSFVPDQIECYGTPSGGIDMTVTNGLAPFIYQWTGPNGFTSNTEDITNIYAGTYVVTVIDSAGCTTVDSLTITQPLSPLWVALISTDICCNGATDGLVDATITGDSPPYIFNWTGPGFSAVTEDISGLAAGMYLITVEDSIGCVISDSVEIHEPTPIVFNFNVYDAACNGDALGIVASHVTGGYGNYGLTWSPGGQTTDSISGLVAGDYILTVSDTCFGDSLVNIYFEDFEGHSPWTLNQFTGANGVDHNLWAINDGEGGVAAGLCGVTANGDTTLHIVTLANPNGRAAYAPGGNCGAGPCPQTNIRAESPFINTVGYSNLTLEFDFLSLGDALNDNCSVLYNDGLGWNVLVPSIKTLNCSAGVGRWQKQTVLLPPSTNNITNLQIGFNWTNNDDGVGSDPSVAINNARIYAPRIFSPTACSVSDTATVGEPTPITSSVVHTNVLCFGDSTGTATATASGGNGNYHYAWSTGAFGALVGNLPAGTYYVTITDTSYTPAGGALGYVFCTHTDSVTITEPARLVAIASPTDVSCFLGSDGQVTVAVSGGVPNYQFVWNTTPPAFTQTVTGLPTNAYDVTVTDLNGCQAFSSTVVAQPSPIAVQMTMTNSTCGSPNGTATATPHGGTPGYTYQWGTSPVQTGPTAVGLMAGLVQVTVTDLNGCQSFGQILVGNEPRPTLLLDFQRNLFCFGGSDGQASVIGSGGRPPYTYSWSNGQTGPLATNLSAGTVFAFVTDFYGCRDTLAVTITEPTAVGGTIIVQDMGCNSTVPDGTIGVLPTGGTPGYTFNWSTVPAQTSQMATGVGPGIYFVTVTDANNCTFVTSDTVRQVPSPSISVGPQVSFCEGEGGAIIFAAGSGTPGPYYYSWWCDTTHTFCGIDSINDNDPLVNPDTSTWYYVIVTDQNGCYSGVDSIFVVVLPKPIVDAGADQVICGDSAPCVLLTPIITGGAPGPFDYYWTPGLTLNDSTIMNPCARPDTTTIYTLQVQAGNGCWSQLTTTDTLATVTVTVAPIPIAEAGPDRDLCYGDTTQLQGYGTGAGPVYGYQWTPAQGLSDSTFASPWAYPPLTTDYTLVVWSNGCPSYADTVTVNVHTIPTVEAGWDREICLGDTAIMDALAWGDSTATYTFQWSPGYGIVGPSGVEDAHSSPDSTTMYYVVATSSWGCESAPDSMTVYLKPTPIADAGPNLTICGADSIMLQGGYYYTTTDSAPSPSQVYFSWVPADSLNDSTLAQPTSWAGQSTMYFLEVRYNTCVTADSMILTVVPELVATISADTSVICDRDSVQLHVTGGHGGATFLWTPSDGLSDPTSMNPMASPDTTTTYHLFGTEGGCTDEGDITIAVIPNPTASYLSSLPDGCPPHTVNFIQNSDDALNFIWNFGEGLPVSNLDFPTHVYETPGSYVVTLIAVGLGGCADTSQAVTVTVYDTARVEFSSDPNFPVEMFLPNTSVDFLNLTQGGTTYTWDFGDGIQVNDLNPTHIYQQQGQYFVTLTATNALGCISRVTHGPYVVAPSDLFIPNVFSPNGDGINDVYLVNYTGSQPFTLSITDRWGVKVYLGNNKTIGWNGKTIPGDDAPEGVYYYYVKIGSKEYTGPVTLMR